MLVFEMRVFSGHIEKVLERTIEIAKAFPQDHFSLNFNETVVTIDPEKPVSEHVHRI